MNKLGQIVTVVTGFKNPPPSYSNNEARSFGERCEYVKRNLRRYYIDGTRSEEELANYISSKGLTHDITVALGRYILDSSIHVDKSTLKHFQYSKN